MTSYDKLFAKFDPLQKLLIHPSQLVYKLVMPLLKEYEKKTDTNNKAQKEEKEKEVVKKEDQKEERTIEPERRGM